MAVEEVLRKCMDAPGYVLFVGTLRSENGNLFLDFNYRRHNLNLEDLKTTFASIRRATMTDLMSTVDDVTTKGGENG